MRCDKCRWWKEMKSEPSLGQCRRFPPPDADYGKEEIDTIDEWPTTNSVCYCGEFAPKEPEKTEGEVPGETIDQAEFNEWAQQEIVLIHAALRKSRIRV